MTDCIFCQIVSKEVALPETIYEDDNFLVFPDKFPKAPIHILLITKKHIPTVAHASAEDKETLGGLLLLAQDIAKRKGIENFSLVFNAGAHAQIKHIHLHLISGKGAGV